MYGSRVLLSIIESEEEERQQIIGAVFDMKREDLVSQVEAGEVPAVVLSAYDYVYDTSQAGG